MSLCGVSLRRISRFPEVAVVLEVAAFTISAPASMGILLLVQTDR
jgi:hypothetical protein